MSIFNNKTGIYLLPYLAIIEINVLTMLNVKIILLIKK